MENSYSFFKNEACCYFPCHKVKDSSDFNCLFCFCPLYALGEKCGGNFFYTEKGIKSCENCLIPHRASNYEYITGRFKEVAALAASSVQENTSSAASDVLPGDRDTAEAEQIREQS